MSKTISKTLVIFVALAMMVSGSALAGSSGAGSDRSVEQGFQAFRAGDFDQAWDLLTLAASKGEPRAQRQLGKMILANKVPLDASPDLSLGVEHLKKAAIAGDFPALIALEDLRRARLAHSPSLGDMIEIEKARAKNGDAVTAWRLAKRYRLGEGVDPSVSQEVHWLELAAATSPNDFPHANEAAFRLCEIDVAGGTASKNGNPLHWCEVASERGNPAARVILRRLAAIAG